MKEFLIVVLIALLGLLSYYSWKAKKERPRSEDMDEGSAKDFISFVEKFESISGKILSYLFYPILGALLLLLVLSFIL